MWITPAGPVNRIPVVFLAPVLDHLLLAGFALAFQPGLAPFFFLVIQLLHAFGLGLDAVNVLFRIVIRRPGITQYLLANAGDRLIWWHLAEMRDAVFVHPFVTPHQPPWVPPAIPPAQNLSAISLFALIS